MEKGTILVACDLQCEEQCQAYLDMLNQYMVHPMGGMDSGLTDRQQQKLVADLKANSTAQCFLLKQGEAYVGFSTTYMLYSTFHAAPYLYIHDVFVRGDHRGEGLGKVLIRGLIDYARRQHCCKVTLEVRADNAPARHLYASEGFIDLDPPMSFWTKELM